MVVVGVLISGRGSNLQAILEAIDAGTLNARAAIVVSNKASAPGLAHAEARGVPVRVLDPKPFRAQASPRQAYDAAVLQVLQNYGVELVILAGYMRIVTNVLIDAYEGRMMNIHPSLLPAFPGLAAQQQALDAGVKVSGCTVHFVTEGVDEGPIIAQQAVPVCEDDTEASLSARILEQEHRLLPQAMQWYAEGRLHIDEGRVVVADTRMRT